MSASVPNWAGQATKIKPSNELFISSIYTNFISSGTASISSINNSSIASFDTSLWYTYPANGNVRATLATQPPPGIPPIPSRQYDINGFRTINALSINLEQDLLQRGTLTTDIANISQGNITIAEIADLRVEGPTTLDGGVLHGISIGCVPVSEVNSQRIDVNAVGIDITSATGVLINGAVIVDINSLGAVECVAATTAGITAGGILTLAGGSHIEYNTDQNYFINTTNGNDQTTIFVGNINGATEGTQPLRIVESRGVVVQNATSIELQPSYANSEWNYNKVFEVDETTFILDDKNNAWRAVRKNSGVFPLQAKIAEWAGNSQDYQPFAIVFVTGLGMYRAKNYVPISSISPNGDTANWESLGLTDNQVYFIWNPNSPITANPSLIQGDKESAELIGSIDTRTINLIDFTNEISDWNSATSYIPGSVVKVVSTNNFYYYSLITNVNVNPFNGVFPSWVANATYVVNNYINYSPFGTYLCIKAHTGSAITPNADSGNWEKVGTNFNDVWEAFAPNFPTPSIEGPVNSFITMGTGNFANLNTGVASVSNINTNTITPLSGSNIGILGNLLLQENNIQNVNTIKLRNIDVPAGNNINVLGSIDMNSNNIRNALNIGSLSLSTINISTANIFANFISSPNATISNINLQRITGQVFTGNLFATTVNAVIGNSNSAYQQGGFRQVFTSSISGLTGAGSNIVNVINTLSTPIINVSSLTANILTTSNIATRRISRPVGMNDPIPIDSITPFTTNTTQIGFLQPNNNGGRFLNIFGFSTFTNTIIPTTIDGFIGSTVSVLGTLSTQNVNISSITGLNGLSIRTLENNLDFTTPANIRAFNTLNMCNNQITNTQSLFFNPFASITTENIDGVDFVFITNPFKCLNSQQIVDSGGNVPTLKLIKEVDNIGPVYNTGNFTFDGTTFGLDYPLSVPAIDNLATINGRNLYAYARFIMDTTQPPSAVNTDNTIAINVDDTPSGALGLSLGANQITCLLTGLYQITIDGQLAHGSGGAAEVNVWLKKNNVNIPNTTQHVRLSSAVEFLTFSATFLVYLVQEDPEVSAADVISAHFASTNVNTGFEYAAAIVTPYDAPERPAFSITFQLIG